MGKRDFFDTPTEASIVKFDIIVKYFLAWSSIIKGTAKKSGNRIAYFDLFCGPGIYKDGTKSIPLQILEKAIENEDLNNMLITVFNDKTKKYIKTLRREINNFPGINKLKYTPEIYNSEVDFEWAKRFEEYKLVPSLLFLDPWGYKGVTQRLINSVLKDWGCDCIFFFNYNRINPAISNKSFDDNIDKLFGKERADKLREKLSDLKPKEKEIHIINEIDNSLKDHFAQYVLPFKFYNQQGTKISHFLILGSKHPRAYAVMKKIMGNVSSSDHDGIPSFEFNPNPIQLSFLGHKYTIENLMKDLSQKFAAQTLSMIQIFENHNYGTNYIEKNYKDALIRMEKENHIIANPPKEIRRKKTFGDKVMVTFPER